MSSSTVAGDDGENDDEGRDDAVDGEFEASQSDEVRPVASTIGHVRHGALVRTNMALYCDDEYYCVGQQNIHNNLSFPHDDVAATTPSRLHRSAQQQRRRRRLDCVGDSTSNSHFTPPDPTRQNCFVASRRIGRCKLSR